MIPVCKQTLMDGKPCACCRSWGSRVKEVRDAYYEEREKRAEESREHAKALEADAATIAALTGKIERIRAAAEEDRKGRCACKMSLGTPIFLECLMHLTIRTALIAAFASVSCGCSDKSSDYKCSVDSWHDVARGASFITRQES